MYSALLTELRSVENSNPTSFVSTFKGIPMAMGITPPDSFGSAFLYTARLLLYDVIPLTLSNPSPPSPAFFPPPPPPALGSLTGSIGRASKKFRFSVTARIVSPDTINYAFFKTDGTPIYMSSTLYSSDPTSWEEELEKDAAAWASFAQVLGVRGKHKRSDPKLVKACCSMADILCFCIGVLVMTIRVHVGQVSPHAAMDV